MPGAEQNGAAENLMDDIRLLARQLFHPEQFAWVIEQLGSDDRKTYTEGLATRLQALVEGEGTEGVHQLARDLMLWVRGWTVSTKLAGDDRWNHNVKEADAGLGAEPMEEIGVQELRRLLV